VQWLLVAVPRDRQRSFVTRLQNAEPVPASAAYTTSSPWLICAFSQSTAFYGVVPCSKEIVTGPCSRSGRVGLTTEHLGHSHRRICDQGDIRRQ